MNKNWQERLKADPIPWLLESNPWTKYRTLTDILEAPPSSVEVKTAKDELVQHPQVKTLLTEASQWFPQCITRHDDAKKCYYKLMMLAELGMNTEDKEMKQIAKQVMERREDGMLALRQELPETGKGFSKPDLNADEWHALPCDSPIITYSLLLMGIKDPAVFKSVEKLQER